MKITSYVRVMGVLFTLAVCLLLSSFAASASEPVAVIEVNLDRGLADFPPEYRGTQWHPVQDLWAVRSYISVDDVHILILVNEFLGERSSRHQVIVLDSTQSDEKIAVKTVDGEVHVELGVALSDDGGLSLWIHDEPDAVRRIFPGDSLLLNTPETRITYHGIISRDELLYYDVIDSRIDI